MEAERPRGSERLGTWLPIVAIILVGAGLRFWRLGRLALLGDEAYYWLWSRHLDWSYFDNPGATAWMIRTSTWIGGPSELGIRWLNALFGVIDIALMYGIGRELFSAQAGRMSAALMAVATPYIITSRFVYTDGCLFPLFLLNMLLLLPILDDADVPIPWWRWALVCLTWLGLLLQTKLSIYPYFAALAIGIILWRRDLLGRPQLWFAAAGASLGLLPFWLWNAAHGWVGLRWIVQQSTRGAILASSELAAMYHALVYLTPPIVLACLLGLALWRRGAGRWLVWIAFSLLLPVLASPADNPRNLLQGSLPLLILAGGFLADGAGASTADPRGASSASPQKGWRWQKVGFALLLGATFMYGLTTVLSVSDRPSWAGNSVAQAIRRDAAGRRSLGAVLRSEERPIITIDYSLAAQLTFYAGRPIYSTWGQYRVWGLPPLNDATIVSLNYVSPELVHERLQATFAVVEGPQTREFDEYGMSGRATLWRGRGLVVRDEELLQRIDFFNLYQFSHKIVTP
jgi:4-amino-4-deoxy-L-arabinose transferase-like glycosyltransferase